MPQKAGSFSGQEVFKVILLWASATKGWNPASSTWERSQHLDLSPLLHVSLGAHMLVRECGLSAERGGEPGFPKQALIPCGCPCGFSSFLSPSKSMGDTLHNTGRLWWTSACSAVEMRIVPFPVVNEIPENLFWDGNGPCLVCGWLRWLLLWSTCCSRISYSEPEAIATLPLESLVWAQRSRQPGGNRTHMSFLKSCWASLFFVSVSVHYMFVSLEIRSSFEIVSFVLPINFLSLCNQETLCCLVSPPFWPSHELYLWTSVLSIAQYKGCHSPALVRFLLLADI